MPIAELTLLVLLVFIVADHLAEQGRFLGAQLLRHGGDGRRRTAAALVVGCVRWSGVEEVEGKRWGIGMTRAWLRDYSSRLRRYLYNK